MKIYRVHTYTCASIPLPDAVIMRGCGSSDLSKFEPYGYIHWDMVSGSDMSKVKSKVERFYKRQYGSIPSTVDVRSISLVGELSI